MAWFFVLIELANHNGDIRRLLDRGYALRFDSNYLVIRDIPYLDTNKGLRWGAIVTKLEFADKVHVKQDDHQIYFAGDVPHEADGRAIPNLAGGPVSVPLEKTDIVVQRSFSNKPPNGFPDFFDKVEHYVALISGPAQSLYPSATPLNFKVDHDVMGDSVFLYSDTLTSRALIGDLAARFKDQVVAIIGLGGTGSYVLDFMAKTSVKEVRGFDGDLFHVHNAYRSPGRLLDTDLKQAKADMYRDRYANFRKGLRLEAKFIDRGSADDLAGVTFAFVCVDKGSARGEIFDLLTDLKIPFVDVGMGLEREHGGLAGMLRATVYQPDTIEELRAQNLAETSDQPGDEYRTNVQISELNAINAALAVLLFKQHCGFYADGNSTYHLLMDITFPKIFLAPDRDDDLAS